MTANYRYACRLFSAKLLGRFGKTAIIWIILIYILLQLTVVLNGSGTDGTFTSRLVSRRIIKEISKVEEKPQTTKPSVSVKSAIRVQMPVIQPQQVDNVIKKPTEPKTDPVHDGVSSTCPSDVRLLRGFQRNTKGFLTIGMSTVPREKVTYLQETIQSLLDKMSPEEKRKVVIVLYIASFNQEFVNATLNIIDSKFSESVTSGLIQVIQPNPLVYPDFSKITKRNFNDSIARVHWRTKQNIDFATLFAYCDRISNYYIHVEDDVIAAGGFLEDIRKMIERVTSNNYKQIWFEVDFSALGFIGRLYRSSDLCLIKKFLLLFQVEKPCDILINDLKHVMMQPKDVRNPKSLFQHVGKTSSLKGKIQNLTDKTFKDLRRTGAKSHRSNVIEKDLQVSFKQSEILNPVAKISTNMETFGDYLPERGYEQSEKGFYWAKSPTIGSLFRMEYNESVYIDAITIRTGHPKKFVDMLDKGSVRVSAGNSTNRCAKYQDVGSFDKGQFYVHFNHTMEARCIEILVTARMKSWLIISEIIVETSDTETTDVPNSQEVEPNKK